MKKCFSCKKTLDIGGKPGRGDTCRFCGADLKACLNCAFYDKSASNECREPMAERVSDKDRANFCEYFKFKESAGETDQNPQDPQNPQGPMSKLKSLFRD